MKIQLLILSLAAASLVTACSHKPAPPPAPVDAPPVAEGMTPPPPPHEHGPGHDHDHPHAFPQEAIEACSGKKVKAKCNFQTPRNDVIRGTCRMTDAPEAVLGCHPNPPKKGKPRK